MREAARIHRPMFWLLVFCAAGHAILIGLNIALHQPIAGYLVATIWLANTAYAERRIAIMQSRLEDSDRRVRSLRRVIEEEAAHL